MTQREMAEAVAKWMGYTRTVDYWRFWVDPSGAPADHPPRCADSLDAMREVEDMLAKRGLFERYVDELMKVQGWITEWAHVWEHHDAWRGLVLATAAQRLAAAAKVTEEEKANG